MQAKVADSEYTQLNKGETIYVSVQLLLISLASMNS
jgi:hypothetical protein